MSQYDSLVGKIVTDDFECRSEGFKNESVKTFFARRPSAFRLKFPNGNWLSTVWGWGSMNENASYLRTDLEIPGAMYRQLGADTVECMWDAKGSTTIQNIEKRLGKENPIAGLGFKDWLWLVNTLAKGKKK